MLTVIAILIMAVALFLTPLGVPGLWIMVLVLAVGAMLNEVGVIILVTATLIALLAELAEYFIVDRLNTRYGGSRLAFWGAILGGVVGVIVGLPVPIVGSIIAGFLGSFAGAMAATLYETRKLDSAARVGWGVLLGRMWSAAVKVALGMVIFVIGAASLLI